MAESTIGRKYGWTKPRAYYKVPHFKSAGLPESELPKSVDLRSEFPDCYDQGQLGSCTANSLAGIIEHNLIKNKYQWLFRPSRLMIYYMEREIEGTVDQDAGAEIHDGIAAVNKYGVCPELLYNGSTPDDLWTYVDDQEKFKLQPPKACYDSAKLHKALHYEQVNLDRNTVLNTLAVGKPISFGFNVYSSFENANTLNTGIMRSPVIFEEEIGGHAIVAVGYFLDLPLGNQGIKDWVLIRNSWGTDAYTQNPHFGNLKGHFLMPLDKIMCNPKMSSDAWVINLVGHAL